MGARFSLRSLSVRVTDRKTSDCRRARLRISVAINENFAFMIAITVPVENGGLATIFYVNIFNANKAQFSELKTRLCEARINKLNRLPIH